MLPLPRSPFAAQGLYTGSVALSPNGKFAYAAVTVYNSSNDNGNAGNTGYVAAFSIDPVTGALSPAAGSPFAVPAGAGAQSVTIDPTGQFMYVGYVGGTVDYLTDFPAGIAGFNIDMSTGGLSPISGSVYAGTGPVPTLISPNDRFLFTAGATYTIDANTRAATPIQNSAGIGGMGVSSAALNVNRTVDDIVVAASDGLSVFAINPTNGALTPVVGSPFLPGTSGSVTVSPNGKNVYALDASQQVAGFAVSQSSGALVPLAGSPFAAQAGGTALAVDATGSFVYISSDSIGGITGFAINPSTGALTPVVGSPFVGPAFVGPTIRGGSSLAFHLIH